MKGQRRTVSRHVIKLKLDLDVKTAKHDPHAREVSASCQTMLDGSMSAERASMTQSDHSATGRQQAMINLRDEANIWRIGPGPGDRLEPHSLQSVGSSAGG
ncbi:hypothetical protein GN958_ATG16095 [Phytophthora infestans]|uniref:Uncharacterized protein n=1 Tax=Phytophthora infestans TaxID=4787 RepID=A0A8S9U6I4_PHYIN|nr:hypothetical protein GN958_ATG16095 [Phytophthora infestans]